MDRFDATDDFYDAISEIQLLINYAKRNTKDSVKYATFNKAAIILLCAKFETFLESILEEYAFFHLTNSTNKTIYPELQNILVLDIVGKLESVKLNANKRAVHIDALTQLYKDEECENLSDYKIKAKFRGGKHGQKEVEKLLSDFGFGNLNGEPQIILFFKKFNSLYSIRNNIVHEDATPSLTHTDVQNYMTNIVFFVDKLNNEIIQKSTV